MDPNGIDPGTIQQVIVNVPASTISGTIEATICVSLTIKEIKAA